MQELVKEQGRRSLSTTGTRPAASQPDLAPATEGAAAEATPEGEQQKHASEPQPLSGASEETTGTAEPPRSFTQEEQQEGCTMGPQRTQDSLQPSVAHQGSLGRRSQGEHAGESQPEQAGHLPSATSEAGELSAGPEALGPLGQGTGRGNAMSIAPAATPEAAGSSRQGSDRSLPQSRCPSPHYSLISHPAFWCAPYLVLHMLFA